jgi:hypothetical protein
MAITWFGHSRFHLGERERATVVAGAYPPAVGRMLRRTHADSVTVAALTRPAAAAPARAVRCGRESNSLGRSDLGEQPRWMILKCQPRNGG